jgi:hypothetical protein
MDLLMDVGVALVSVALGWGLATLTQLGVSRQQEKDTRLASAYSVFHKVRTYAADLAGLCEHIMSKQERATKLNRELWTVLRPVLLPHDEPAQFTAEELAIFFRCSDHAGADRLISLATLYNVIRKYWGLYIGLVETLDELAEPLASAAPDPSEFDVDERFSRAYPVKVMKVRSLANELVRLASSKRAEVDDMAVSVGPMLAKSLGDKRFDLTLARRDVEEALGTSA